MDVTEKLQALIDSGLNQYKIAESCGVSQATISRISSGKQEQFSWKIAEAINEMYAEEVDEPQQANVA